MAGNHVNRIALLHKLLANPSGGVGTPLSPPSPAPTLSVGPISFFYMQFLAQILPNNRSTPPIWKILEIRHCKSSIKFSTSEVNHLNSMAIYMKTGCHWCAKRLVKTHEKLVLSGGANFEPDWAYVRFYGPCMDVASKIQIHSKFPIQKSSDTGWIRIMHKTTDVVVFQYISPWMCILIECLVDQHGCKLADYV